jgi:hypothetical protein
MDKPRGVGGVQGGGDCRGNANRSIRGKRTLLLKDSVKTGAFDKARGDEKVTFAGTR